MHFLDYPSNIFAGINSTEQNILTADSNVLWLNSLTVCNTVGSTLRFNLKKRRIQENSIEIFLVNELEIKPFQTVDIVQELGLKISLQYQQIPAISDNLICFSKGLKQIFDCEVCYSKLNELPYSV